MSATGATRVRMTGTDIVSSIVFSPDGEWIAFYSSAAAGPTSQGSLKKVAVSGGTPVRLCDMDSPSRISWGQDGIIFAVPQKGIMRVSPEGGEPQLLVATDDEEAFGPQMLPDGDSLLFTLAAGSRPDRWDRARIVVQSLTSGRRKTIIEGANDGRYVSSGHIVYGVGRVLFARPFDLARLEATGRATPVVEGVRRGSGFSVLATATIPNAMQFSVAENGSLVYIPALASASPLQQLLVMDNRAGEAVPLKLPPAAYQFPRVSPDGRHIAFVIDDGNDASVSTYDLSAAGPARRLTFAGTNRYPIWSSDGQWIAFQSDRDGAPSIYRQRANGRTASTERLTRADAGTSHVPESWSGDTLLFSSTSGENVSLMTLSLRDKTTMPFPNVQTTVWPNAAFSPDGEWVAYSVREPGRRQNTLYVQPFPPTGDRYQVADNAHFPTWARDGRELFFVDPSRSDDGRVGFVAVRVSSGPVSTFSDPVPIRRRSFNVIGPGIGRSRTYDVMPDGRHFIGVTEEGQLQELAAVQRIEVVLGWFEELKRLVPTN
jgi:eukaryotic-like serine/threonine-protein kinase